MARYAGTHYMASGPISIDNAAPTSDYWATKFMTPAVEGSNPGIDHQVYGGWTRDAPLPVVPGELGAGVSVSRPYPAGYGDYELVDFKVDVARMYKAGFDFAAIDILGPSGKNFTNTQKLITASAQHGTFKTLLIPDVTTSSMGALTGTQMGDLLVGLIQLSGGTGCFKLDDGRYVIAPFCGTATIKDASYWNAVWARFTANGISATLIPLMNSLTTTIYDFFDTLSYNGGYAAWGTRDPGTSDSMNGVPAAMRARPGNANKIFMFPVSSWDDRPRSQEFSEPRGFELLLKTSRRALIDAAGPNDLVQVVTYNDYAENSVVSPSRRRKNLTHSDGYTPVSGMEFVIQQYMTQLKAGTGSLPTPTVDTLMIAARNQLVAPIVVTTSALTAGATRTTLPVAALSAAQAAALTVGTKLHSRTGQVLTVTVQPATSATSVTVNSFVVPAAGYVSNYAWTKRTWTYVPPSETLVTTGTYTGGYKAQINRKYGGIGSTNSSDGANIVHILGYLYSGGTTIKATIGGVTTTVATNVGPGEVDYQLTNAVGTAPTVWLERSSTEILRATSPEAVSATPFRQDFSYLVDVAQNPPSTGPGPEILPTPTRIFLAQDTSANLTASNEIIGPGEVVIESDTGRIKIGDNATAYSNLAYLDQVIRSYANPDMLAVGESILPLGRYQETNTTTTNGSGSIRFCYFTALKTETITQTRIPVGSVGASGLTLCRIGLFTVASNGDLTRVAVTNNNATLLASAGAEATQAFAAPYTKVAGTRYAYGVLQIGTTTANFCGATSSGGIGVRAAREPRLGAFLTGQTDMPTSITAGSLTATASFFNADLLPA